MALSAAQFSEHLIRSGLLPEEQIRAAAQSVGGLTEDSSAEGLAKQLVRDGRLTLFQAQLAVNGKAAALVLGSYLILEKLGQGGMGQVYKARHRTMKREVALKVISAAVLKDETSLRRFQREVEAAAQLNHPHIVTAHDAGEHKGTHFLVMELVRGADLASIVKKSGPMKAAQAVRCVLQAAKGLAYAHSNGIVHRDIKPANLLLDESNTIKILDMGLARFEEASEDHASVAGLTGTGMLMGTIDYMSPEQAMDSKTADARSDIYSLGCTLYYLLTGQAVYVEDTVMKRIMAHQTAAIPQLPILDKPLQTMFERMIAKKPEQRYQSTDELANDLQSWLTAIESDRVKVTAEMPITGGGSWDVPEDVSFRGESRPKAEIAVQTRTETRRAETPPQTTPSGSADQATIVPNSIARTASRKSTLGPGADQLKSSGVRADGKNADRKSVPPSRRSVADNKKKVVEETPGKAKNQTSKSARTWLSQKMLAIGGAAVLVVVIIVIVRSTGDNSSNTNEVTDQGHSAGESLADNAESKSTNAAGASESLPDSRATGDTALAESDFSKLNLTADATSPLQPTTVPQPEISASPNPVTEMTDTTMKPAASNASDATETSESGSAALVAAVTPSPDSTGAKEPPSEKTPSVAGTLAPAELRLKERSADLPPFKNVLRPGQPLGEFAAVSSPGKVDNVISWSIEPVMHRAMFRCIDVSSEGLIATGGTDNSVRIWTKDWQLIRILPGHANAVSDVAFSPDGKWLASVSRLPHAMLALWDVSTGQLTAVHDVNHWNGQIAWMPDGERVARGTPDGLEIMNVRSGETRKGERTKHHCHGVAVSPDGNRIACTIYENAAQIFETSSLRNFQAIENFSSGFADWSHDGKWIAIGNEQRSLVLDTRSYQVRAEFSYGGIVKFSPDSTMLAVASVGKTAILSSKDWSLMCEFPAQVSHAFDWSADGRQLHTSNGSYDVETGRPTAHPMLSATSPVVSAVSSDGRRVATISSSRLRLWDGANGQLLNETVQDQWGASQFLWQPNGSKILKLISSREPVPSALTLIDGETGKTQVSPTAPLGMIWRAAWSSDGSRFASVGEDGLCRIWDASSATELQKFAHADPIWWVQWSNDGTKVATGSAFSAISVWDVEAGKLIREFKTLSKPMQAPQLLTAADGPFGFLKGDTQLFYMAGDHGFEVLDLKSGQISSLGQVDLPGGNRLSAAWSKDFNLLGIYDVYNEFHLYAAGDTKPVTSIRFFMTPHWLADGKRLLGGDNSSTWLCGYDLRRKKRLGVLIPELGTNSWAALSSDGHFIGSSDAKDHLVVVAMHRDGRLLTMTMEEFQNGFKWVNNPENVRLLD